MRLTSILCVKNMVESQDGKWNQSSSVFAQGPEQIESMFRLLFENSVDATLVIDAAKRCVVECNEAAVKMSCGGSRQWLLSKSLLDLSPEHQADGRKSEDKLQEITNAAIAKGTQKFEWLAHRFNGEIFPLEVVITPVCCESETFLVVFSRDISERKKEEHRVQRVNEDLESRVRERTLELVQANEKLKAEVKERRRKEKVQRALYEISEAIHTTEDLDSLFVTIHKSIQQLMDARNFYIALHDPVSGLVHFPYFVDEIDQRPEPLKLTSGLTSYVLRTGKPLLVNRKTEIQKLASGVGVLSDGATHFQYQETGSPAAVWLGAPLASRGKTFGVIGVQHYQNEDIYKEEEKQILTFVAEQIALVIERKQAEEARKEAEAALRQANRELTALIETLPGYAFYKDRDGRYCLGNENLCQAVGISQEMLVGKTDFDLFPREVADKFRADDLRLIAAGEPLFIGEETMQVRDKRILLETQKAPVKDDHGNVIGVIGAGFDITKRKQAEEELLKALAREKELSQMKTNFVSTVSHEFRTPLGIIMSSSQILHDYFKELNEEERLEHLRSITSSTRHMAALMEEVLLLSRVDSGTLACQRNEMKLRPFIQRLVDEINASDGKEHTIVVDTTPMDIEVRLDEKLLRHILANLLLNAVKYSPSDTPVQLTVTREGPDVCFTVADQGIGIPEADQQWLFHAFHRGRNVGERPGTGLGLTIVKRCVDLHGGSIQLQSKVGQGTTLIVKLPAEI